MLRARIARAAVADLVVEMGRPRPGPSPRVPSPTLWVIPPCSGLWAPSQDRVVDAAGQVMSCPKTVRPGSDELERNGVREAAIVHDAILLDEPGLIAASPVPCGWRSRTID